MDDVFLWNFTFLEGKNPLILENLVFYMTQYRIFMHKDKCSINVCWICIEVGKILHKLILSLFFSLMGHFLMELTVSFGLHVFKSIYSIFLFLKYTLGE